MKSYILIIFLLYSSISSCQWTQKGQTIFGDTDYELFAASISLSANADIMAIGAYEDVSQNPLVKVYSWDGNHWNQLGLTLTNSFATGFGKSVSLSDNGDILAIGAYTSNGLNGHVQVFHWNETSWIQLGADISNGSQDAQSGFSVSLSSDGFTLAVGSPAAGSINEQGEVQIFTWNGLNWIQKGQTLIGEALHDESGESVSLSGDGNVIAIGAENNDGNGVNSGHVRVYSWDGSSWIQKGIDIDGHQAWERSGVSVSISDDGNILAIGARYNQNSNGIDVGCARIYNWDGNTWTQVGSDIIGMNPYDEFGQSVSLSSDGTSIVIGARIALPGYAHIYKWDGSIWDMQFAHVASSGNQNIGRSTSIAADGNTVALGGPYGGVINDSGYAKVFKMEMAELEQLESRPTSIYPNPANNSIQVLIQSDIKLIRILSFDGKICLTSGNKVLDVSGLIAGSYIVEVTGANEILAREILLIE